MKKAGIFILMLALSVFFVSGLMYGGEEKAVPGTEKTLPENIKDSCIDEKTGGIKKECIESARYYPARLGNEWYLKATRTGKPEEILKIKAVLKEVEERDGKIFNYFYAPGVDVRFKMRKVEGDGVYMSIIVYPFPLFGFPVEAHLKPDMKIMDFPLEAGKKWSYEGKAEAHILFIPITRDIKADFEIKKKEVLSLEAGEIETYNIEVVLDDGSGEGPNTEKYWYGKGTGYTVAAVKGHTAYLTGYKIYDSEKEEYIIKLPEDHEEYK